MRRSGFTLIELMIVIAIIAIVAAIALPGLLRARISANERSASTCLKTVVSAEEIFRGNDVDRNGINDYWTGDLSGLYCMANPVTLKVYACLSDVGMVQADVYRYEDFGGNYNGLDMDGDGSFDVGYGGSAIIGTARSPKSGYWYQALQNDEIGNVYGLNTDGMGPCHNYGQYGFAAVPAAWDSVGNFCFVVNVVGSVFRRDFGLTTAVPAPAVQLLEFSPGNPFDFPDATILGANWSKVE